MKHLRSLKAAKHRKQSNFLHTKMLLNPILQPWINRMCAWWKKYDYSGLNSSNAALKKKPDL